MNPPTHKIVRVFTKGKFASLTEGWLTGEMFAFPSDGLWRTKALPDSLVFPVVGENACRLLSVWAPRNLSVLGAPPGASCLIGTKEGPS